MFTRAPSKNFVGATGGVIAPAVGANAVDSPRKVIVITGASRGLGLSITKHLALSPYFSKQGGLDIVMTAGRPEPLMREHNDLQLLIQQNMLHTRLLPFVADFATDFAGSASKIARQVATVFGARVDTVIFNAGMLEPLKRIANYDARDIQQLAAHFHVNVLANFALTTELMQSIKQASNPRLIYLSSNAANKPLQAWSAYSCSKAAINTFVQVLAEEEPHLTVLAVSPGPTESSMQQTIRNSGGKEMEASQYEKFVKLYENNELTSADDAAHFVAACAMAAPHSLSGGFLSFNDETGKTLMHTYRDAVKTVAGPNV